MMNMFLPLKLKINERGVGRRGRCRMGDDLLKKKMMPLQSIFSVDLIIHSIIFSKHHQSRKLVG